MMKRFVLPLALAAACVFVPAAHSQVIVRVRPPRVVIEHPAPPPRAGYVWTPGYYRWAGAHYVWVPGSYVLPPRPAAVWIAPRWVMRGGTWVFVRGYWR